MTTLPVCKSPRCGAHHSIAELNGVTHVLVTALPQTGATFEEQVRDVLTAVDQAMRSQGATGAVIHQTVFLASPDLIEPCRELLRRHYGLDMPATTYIPQPPCGGELVAIEALGFGGGREKMAIDRVSEQVVVVRQDGVTWVYADDAVPITSAEGVYEKTICSYQHLRRLLPAGGARLDQVIRTWLYLGDIVDDNGPMQRYKELNRGRTDVYDGVAFMAERLPETYSNGPVYPASTGIGTEGRGLYISALALVSDNDDVIAVPLENPRQTAAFAYCASYSPKSPKFSRALALCCGNATTLFISGTASITNSETVHIGDVVGQTHETLDNIAALIGEDNLAGHKLPGRGTTLDHLGVIRVYIKNRADYPAVHAACEARLPTVPKVYVVADVCRPDLLVEIEGIAFSHRVPVPGDPHPAPRARCATGTANPTACNLLCPDGCPERFGCPHAVLR